MKAGWRLEEVIGTTHEGWVGGCRMSLVTLKAGKGVRGVHWYHSCRLVGG